jgi:hypothetical protein
MPEEEGGRGGEVMSNNRFKLGEQEISRFFESF